MNISTVRGIVGGIRGGVLRVTVRRESTSIRRMFVACGSDVAGWAVVVCDPQLAVRKFPARTFRSASGATLRIRRFR